MKERAALIAAVLVLFGGLGAWALVAERAPADPDLSLSRPPAPPIGVAVRADEAGPERQLLERAMLGGVPRLRLFARNGEPVFGILSPGRDALALRDRIRSAGSERVPVIVGDAWAVDAHAAAIATTGDPPDAIVRRARGFDAEAWLRARAQVVRAQEGAWPEDASEPTTQERYGVVRDRRWERVLPEVAIALLPIADPAEAPASLAFGNWAGCPEPTVHVAVLTRWRERWGAEVIAIGEDRIELRVARPPDAPEAALALAREHAAYAPALIGGGTRTLAALAAERLGARSWSFRWPRGTRVP